MIRGWAGKRISRTVHTSLVYLTRNCALLHRRIWISTGQRERNTKCKERTYAIDLVWPRQTGPLRLLPPYLKSVIIACVADQYKDDMLSMLYIHTDCKYGASNHWCTVHQWFFWTLLLIGRKGNRDMSGPGGCGFKFNLYTSGGYVCEPETSCSCQLGPP